MKGPDKIPETQSPLFKQILDMRMNFSDAEFRENVSSLDAETARKISEDIVISNLQGMIQGQAYQRMINAVMAELKKPVMKDNPNKNLFEKVLQEIINK